MSSAVEAMASPVPDREITAQRLLKTSAKHSYDPAVEIDWDAPLAPDRYYLDPRRSSLYGTALWDRMSEPQRIALTRHELASLYNMGIWFETILMQMLIRHIYDRPKGSAHARYGWTEIADECRHPVMFSRAPEKFGGPDYGPGVLVHHPADRPEGVRGSGPRRRRSRCSGFRQPALAADQTVRGPQGHRVLHSARAHRRPVEGALAPRWRLVAPAPRQYGYSPGWATAGTPGGHPATS